MRAVVQRVSRAAVSIDGAVHAAIDRGLLILLGVSDTDDAENARYLAEKCAGLRIFTDENDKMNRSVSDVGGEILVISQFTLYGDCRRGKRPSFTRAARAAQAIPLYEAFAAHCARADVPVKTGVFGADMQVELVNDGPVTIMLDTDDMKKEG